MGYPGDQHRRRSGSAKSGSQDGGDDQASEDGWQSVHHVGGADPGGGAAQADRQADDQRGRADRHGRTEGEQCAVTELGEDVAPDRIGAQRVCP